MALIRLTGENCERIANMVVKAPAPAISGKTTGKKLESFGESGVSLKMEMSNIISQAITKIINEPATAKDAVSTPKRFKNISPKK